MSVKDRGRYWNGRGSTQYRPLVLLAELRAKLCQNSLDLPNVFREDLEGGLTNPTAKRQGENSTARVGLHRSSHLSDGDGHWQLVVIDLLLERGHSCG